MQRLMDKGLEQLTATVFKMGEVAEKALTIAIGGFVKGKDTSEDVHELSEVLVAMTVEVEEKSFSLIAKYQPVASDLRIINSYMKIAYDFERYGRYAWDISYLGKRFGKLDSCDKWVHENIGVMGEKVLQMVKISNTALKSFDTELVKIVTETETEVDELYSQCLNKIVERAEITNECTVTNVLVVRYLERIADHATYLTEAVVYIATGKKASLR
ncbi:MAG: phosphate signaling complex protein PhoU [Candidatus Bathyarchaeota archaeon]|nr:phosphate signaling complex protein PhoU [Candidatus Bathyarchaeota archaeon]